MRNATIPNDVKTPRNSVNRRGTPISRRLMPLVANAAKAEPVKVLALKTGISARVLTDLREERHLPSMPTFFALALHDPALRRLAVAILSGEAESGSPESINTIVNHMQGRGE